ncbi:hypothetical protein GQ44DRAFT_492590 [Phaeosphaeriaceae sp. PMI808]|nr:hypothetical protein GQ44DRAFT_492590 [Phaeosphaeriaceae sp. PMI808]
MTTLDIRLCNLQFSSFSYTNFLGIGGPTLRHFLSGLENLIVLAVGFGSEKFWKNDRDCQLLQSVYRIIPLEHYPWPQLRSLRLENKLVAEWDFSLLLRIYESTLRYFHLEGLKIGMPNNIGQLEERARYRKEAWQRIFRLFARIFAFEICERYGVEQDAI